MNTNDPRLDWLVDRALISDLLIAFAWALDSRDWPAYADLYAEDGSVELPDPQQPGQWIVLQKAQMTEVVPKTLGRYAGTHHLSTNHSIALAGDRASSRSYLQAVHIRSPTDHWTGGGWYECDYVRTSEGWRFSHVRLNVRWLDGEVGPIRPD